MNKKPLLLGFFAALAFHLPCVAQTANTGTATLNSDRNQSGQTETLPQTGSALPLLSTIGAGVLLGGLVSARRTRSHR